MAQRSANKSGSGPTDPLEPRYEAHQPPHGINADPSQKGAFIEFSWLLIVFGALLVAAGFIAYQAGSLFGRFAPWSWEEALYAEAMHPVFPGELDDEAEERVRLQAIADRIAASDAWDEDVTVTIHYVRSEEVNAYTTFGGHIYLTSAILELIPDEASQAALIGHEMGHIEGRHLMRSLSGQLFLQITFAAITGDNDFLDSVAGSAGLVEVLSFTRALEQDADEFAVETQIELFGDTQGLIALFEMLEEIGGASTGGLPWLQSHPQLNERILHIRNLAD